MVLMMALLMMKWRGQTEDWAKKAVDEALGLPHARLQWLLLKQTPSSPLVDVEKADGESALHQRQKER